MVFPKNGRKKIINLLKEIGIKKLENNKMGYSLMQWNLNQNYFKDEN